MSSATWASNSVRNKYVEVSGLLIPNKDLRVVVERAMAQPYDLGPADQRLFRLIFRIQL
jgi:hypothetical protein